MAKTYDLLVRARGETKDAERAIKQLQGSLKSAGRKMQDAGRLATKALTLPILGAAAASVKLASDAGETASKMQVTFGKQRMDAINKQLDAFAKATGASRYALREQTTTIGALLKPMKLGGKATADMSVKVAKLATDLSSFNNVPVEDALDSLKSGLTGETEPLKKFGILMNEAAVQAEAVRMGLIKNGETLTEQQKVQARYSLILKQTTDAQGDAERTSGSFANQMKATKNSLIDIGVSIGQILLPYAQKLLGWVREAIGWFQGLSPHAQRIAIVIAGIAAAAGPLVFILGSMVSASAALVPVLAAITGPALLVAAGIAALGVAFVAAYTKSEKFRAQVNSAFRDVAATVRVLVAQMSVTIREFVATAKIVWARWGEDIMGVVGPALKVIVTLVKFNMGMILDQIRFGLAILRGDWGDAWDLLKGMVRRALGAAADVARNSGKAVVRAVRGLGDGIAALKDYFVQKGEAIGRAIAHGISSAVKGAASGIADAAKDAAGSAVDKVIPDIPGLGRSRRGAKRAASGVTALGQIFGPSVSAGQVMRYVGLDGAQPYSVSQNGDGTETLNTNKAIVAFLKERKRINKRQLRKRIAQRNAMMKKVKAAKKAWLAAKRSKVPSDAKAKKARLKRIQSAFKTLVKRAEAVAELNAEILTLGGAIEDDAEALTPPEIDTVADVVEEDGVATDAGDTTTTTTTTTSTTGVSGTGISSTPLTQGSNYNPLMPTSQSALGAVASSVLRSMGGTTVNLIANSGDPEAIAHRVAFFLGSSRLRAGGGF